MALHTLMEAVRSVAPAFMTPALLNQALDAVGEKATQSLDGQAFDARAGLVSFFVRNVKDLPMDASTRLERELMNAVGAAPPLEKRLPIKNALGVLAVRNHLKFVATFLGLDWQAGMHLQSGVSDLARLILARGGGELVVRMQPGGLSLEGIFSGAAGGAFADPSSDPMLANLKSSCTRSAWRPGGAGGALVFDVLLAAAH